MVRNVGTKILKRIKIQINKSRVTGDPKPVNNPPKYISLALIQIDYSFRTDFEIHVISGRGSEGNSIFRRECSSRDEALRNYSQLSRDLTEGRYFLNYSGRNRGHKLSFTNEQ